MARSRAATVRRAWRLAVWPAVAVLLFLLISRITTGLWFVASGFFEPDANYDGQLTKSLLAVWWGTHRLGTRAAELVALVGVALLVVRASSTRRDAPLLIPLALLAFAALPVYAFYEGHPFRIRYMIPAAAACAVLSGMAVGCLRERTQVIVGESSRGYCSAAIAAVVEGGADDRRVAMGSPCQRRRAIT